MNAPSHSPAWHLDHFDRAAARFAEVVADADLETPVPSCGDVPVASLVRHLGMVHQWAQFCAEHAREPTSDDPQPEPFDADRAAEWYDTTATDLGAALRSIDPDAPTWHPFPVDRVARVWPRRQAHETAMHLWDLEHAVATPTRFDPEFASDGIDEYFELVIPRLITRESMTVPDSSLHVHCTDVEGEWLVWNDGGEYRWKRAHEKGDAALRGPAEAILLALWNRPHALGGELSPVGDESALDAWLSIPGM